MKTTVFKGLAIAFTVIALLNMVSSLALADGNDFLDTSLRTDLPEIYSAHDFRLWLGSRDHPVGGYPTFTAAWLGIKLDNKPGTFGQQFTQVGLKTNAYGLFWFVYAEPGVHCLRGTPDYWNSQLGKHLGCHGDIGDIVSPDYLSIVELVVHDGDNFWTAKVYDGNGNPYDVAEIYSPYTYIYNAYATMEEGYTSSQDPYVTAAFFIYNPQYMDWQKGSFQPWPASEGNHTNSLRATDLQGINSFCPQYYGAIVNILSDPRYWFAGTTGNICNWIMFPSFPSFLPMIMKNYPG